jgi:hypothetical protein
MSNQHSMQTRLFQHVGTLSNLSISSVGSVDFSEIPPFQFASSAARPWPIAYQFADQLQLQERLTHQIADEIQRVTSSEDVFVVGRGEHLCMSMRGIKTPAIMSNSVVRGKFRDLPVLRAEALSLMGRR